MAPQGPMLPRKNAGLRRSREGLENVAHQVGVVIAIERNRMRLTQWELATAVGIGQNDVSHVETGKPANITDTGIRRLFRKLDLPPKSPQARFIMWWRDNATT